MYRLKEEITPSCFICGSNLILISTTTSQIGGYLFPQTKTAYRCSNQDCQDEKDRQSAKRLKLQADRALADQEHAAAKLEQKKAKLG